MFATLHESLVSPLGADGRGSSSMLTPPTRSKQYHRGSDVSRFLAMPVTILDDAFGTANNDDEKDDTTLPARIQATSAAEYADSGTDGVAHDDELPPPLRKGLIFSATGAKLKRE